MIDQTLRSIPVAEPLPPIIEIQPDRMQRIVRGKARAVLLPGAQADVYRELRLSTGDHVLTVVVSQVWVCRKGDLEHRDALALGFDSRMWLLRWMDDILPDLAMDSPVTVIRFQLRGDSSRE